MPHRFFDHTADIGLDVWAPSPGELFTDALRAFTDTLTPLEDLEREGAAVARPLHLAAPDLDELMVLWLEELLFLFEVEEELYTGATVAIQGDGGACSLDATLRGVAYDPDHHPLKLLIKAVTYHGLEVVEEPEAPSEERWRARVIFDI